MKCPNCGEKICESDVVCWNCGTSVSGQAEGNQHSQMNQFQNQYVEPPMQYGAPKKTSKSTKVIIGAILGVIVIGVVSVFAYRYLDEKNKKKQSQSSKRKRSSKKRSLKKKLKTQILTARMMTYIVYREG